jgi:hypothetical protein
MSSKAQLAELFCDAFALAGRTIMDAAGQFTPAILDALTERLVLLSRAFLLEDMIAMHGEGPSAVVNVGRLSKANKSVPVGEPFVAAATHFESHPSSLQRFTSLWLHSAWICRNAGAVIDPLRPNGETDLNKMLQNEWRNDTRLVQDMTIDSLRLVEPAGEERLARLFDRLHQLLGIKLPRTPPGLKAFGMAALSSFVMPFLKNLGETDDKCRRELKDLADTDVFARLPPDSKLGSLVATLCGSILDAEAQSPKRTS